MNTIIQRAEEWVGTPFHDQARQKQVGCDCIGLILGIAQEMNAISLTHKPWKECDVIGYSSINDSALLLTEIPKHFLKITFAERQPGDILLVKIHNNQYHVCIYDERRIIHACSTVGKVISHRLIPSWQILNVFRYNIKGI